MKKIITTGIRTRSVESSAISLDGSSPQRGSKCLHISVQLFHFGIICCCSLPAFLRLLTLLKRLSLQILLVCSFFKSNQKVFFWVLLELWVGSALALTAFARQKMYQVCEVSFNYTTAVCYSSLFRCIRHLAKGPMGQIHSNPANASIPSKIGTFTTSKEF